MKKLIAPELYLPLAILIIGFATPSLSMIMLPANAWFTSDLFYWYAICLTISGAIAAVKLTFNRLTALSADAKAENIFELEEEKLSEAAILNAHAKTAELIILGVALMSLITGAAPSDMPSLLLFTSLRIGEILFLLGGIVMVSTHFKMRKL
jgi:hypothetical protein